MAFYGALIALLMSAVTTGLIVRTAHLHGHMSGDGVSGAQKIHSGTVPRIGGVAVALGIAIGGLFLSKGGGIWGLVALCALPAFAAGLVEDITKRVSVRMRLMATIVAGAIFAVVTGYTLHHLALPGVDLLLAQPLVAVAFTAFAIGGIANAMNIVDGCNGLSAMTSILLFGVFGLIAGAAGDPGLFAVCMLFAGAIAGFLVWNFPFGKIFLGDAGAYSVGFALAAVAVALPARNPSVSPVIGLLVLCYPVAETVYSMARRARKESSAVGQPDSMHLHSLTFKALRGRIESGVLRNSAAGAAIWALPLTSSLLAYALWRQSTGIVLLACAAHFVLYCVAYTIAERAARRATPVPATSAAQAESIIAMSQVAATAKPMAHQPAPRTRTLVSQDATGS